MLSRSWVMLGRVSLAWCRAKSVRSDVELNWLGSMSSLVDPSSFESISNLVDPSSFESTSDRCRFGKMSSRVGLRNCMSWVGLSRCRPRTMSIRANFKHSRFTSMLSWVFELMLIQYQTHAKPSRPRSRSSRVVSGLGRVILDWCRAESTSFHV